MRPTPKTIEAVLDELIVEDKQLNVKILTSTSTGIRIRMSGKVPTILDAHRTAADGTTVLSYTRDGSTIIIVVTDTPEEEERLDILPEEIMKIVNFIPQELDRIEIYALGVMNRRVEFTVWNELDKCIFYGGLGSASL
jgi:hypothetical protein